MTDVKCQCKVCKKPMVVQFDPMSGLEEREFNFYLSMVTCDDCLREKGYLKRKIVKHEQEELGQSYERKYSEPPERD